MDFLQKLINNARNKLYQEKSGNLKIKNDNYRNFLKNISDKKCPSCGQELKLLSATSQNNEDVESVSYEFVCGHKHHEIYISETIKIWESVKGKMRKGENKPHYTFLSRTESGKNPKSVDGVSISWSADRKNNKWDHIITDIKTGKILHEEHVSLDKHGS